MSRRYLLDDTASLESDGPWINRRELEKLPKKRLVTLLEALTQISEAGRYRIQASVDLATGGVDALIDSLNDLLAEIIVARREARSEWWDEGRHWEEYPDWTRVRELVECGCQMLEAILELPAEEQQATAQAVERMLLYRNRKRNGEMWEQEIAFLQKLVQLELIAPLPR